MPEHRRFPPPWSVEEYSEGGCFIVRDHNGQALAYVYCEDEPGRRAAAHLLLVDRATDLFGRRRRARAVDNTDPRGLLKRALKQLAIYLQTKLYL